MAVSVIWVMPNRVKDDRGGDGEDGAQAEEASPRRPAAAAPRGLVPQATSR